jgi:hypothetical protein
MPRPGQVVLIGKACGVPYTFRPIYFAVAEIAAHQPHAEGAWLIGYELNEHLRAVDRREIYVGQLDGLRDVTAHVAECRRQAAAERRRNGGPVPQQRTRTTPTTTTSGRTR